MWRSQARALETDHRVVMVDLRGHGETEAPPGPYSLDTLGADLMTVADRVGTDRFHLVGISLGGQIALWAAVNHPERLLSVVLSNTAPRIGTFEGWHERIALVRRDGMPGISRSVVGRWFSAGFPDRHPDRFSEALDVFESTDPQGYIGCCHALADADLSAEVERVAVPALVIGGEVDVSTPPAGVRRLHEQITGSRLTIMSGVAHLPNLEKPDEYSDILSDWLAR